MSTWNYECPACDHEHEIEVEYENSPAEGVVGWTFVSEPPDYCENPECGARLPSMDTLGEKMDRSMSDRGYD